MHFLQPVASRESFAQGVENGRENNNTHCCEEFDTAICSRSTQEKRLRKTSKVNCRMWLYLYSDKNSYIFKIYPSIIAFICAIFFLQVKDPILQYSKRQKSQDL